MILTDLCLIDFMSDILFDSALSFQPSPSTNQIKIAFYYKYPLISIVKKYVSNISILAYFLSNKTEFLLNPLASFFLKECHIAIIKHPPFTRASGFVLYF